MADRRLIICITGMPGCGKTTVARMLSQRGFKVVEMVSPIRKLMRVCGIKVDVDSIGPFAIKLKQAFGKEIIAKMSEDAILNAKGDIAVAGIRSMDELAYLRAQNPNVVALAVSTPRALRYRRLMARKGGVKASNYKEFASREREHVAQQGTLQAIRASDYMLSNSGTISQLHADLDELIPSLRSRHGIEPRCHARPRRCASTNGEVVICLTGMPGSGKTTIARMLKRKGFTTIENSASLKKLMRMYDIGYNVKNMESVMVRLRKQFGNAILSKFSSKAIAGTKGDVVISGPRNRAEFDYIAMLKPHMAVVAVIAPKQTRFERLVRRRDGMPMRNYKEFEWRDRKNVALGTMKMVRDADYALFNTGTISQLHADLDDLIRLIRDGKHRELAAGSGRKKFIAVSKAQS